MNGIRPRIPGAPTIHVVVSCKSRKTVAISHGLSMSSIGGTSLRERASSWTRALEISDVAPRRAGDLYAGDHWKVVLGIPEVAAGRLNVELWVVSAGYGLVGIDTPLKPYSATFIRPHAESVVPLGAMFTTADWWQELGNWSREPNSPRRIADLARKAKSENGFVLLALSEPYAAALSDDIATASRLAEDRVALVAVGLSGRGMDNLSAALPVKARLKRIVGGAMQGINARIAHRIVAEHERWYPSIERLRELVNDWADGVDDLPKYNRDRMNDDEVRSFILAQASAMARHSKSDLLRRLRDSGRACEQARFGRLYKEAIASINKRAAIGELGAEA